MRAESVAVVIPTRNGQRTIADTLRHVLAAADRAPYAAQVVVVDNGSTDDTPRILADLAEGSSRVIVLRESKPGSAAAKNSGVRQALTADAVLFTDDDVLVPANWVTVLADPLLSGRATAVAGAVHLEPSLVQDAMTDFHLELLADSGAGLGDPPRTLIGASMAIQGRVFHAGFRFDEHLGPGALGFMEESLLHHQITAAGGTSTFVDDAAVVHRVDARRLSGRAWIDRAARQGACEAWMTYHWEHRRINKLEVRGWLRGEARLLARGMSVGTPNVPSARDLQRVRRVAAGRWWLRNAFARRIYPEPRWVPAALARTVGPAGALDVSP